MKKAQEKKWSKRVSIGSLSQMAQEIGIGLDKKRLNRLKYSFKILANTRMEFHNCFIDTGVLQYFEGEYDLIDIGILSDYSLKQVRARGNPIMIEVVFNENFLALCRHSLGYKLIPFEPIKGLRDTAYALYKWAWRWYNNEKGYGERWIGSGKKLVEWYKNELNSIAKYKYPAEIIRRLESAIKQLNENKEAPLYFELKKEGENYKIEIYRKGKKVKREIPFDKLPIIIKKAVIGAIEKTKKNIREPYAFARSMSWKELEKLLKKYAVVELPKEGWGLIKFSWEVNPQNKLLFDKDLIAVSEQADKVQLVFPKQVLRRTNEITKFLDVATPKWKETVIDAGKLIEGIENLVRAEANE
jgi:hypothetical protein